MPTAVIGMHRSGTSMVTRLLAIAGMYIGEESDLPPIHPTNPTGHWEHLPLMEINERILTALGGTWWDLPTMEPDWIHLPEIQAIRRDAEKVVTGAFAGREPWGWKDPRTTVTIPFWQDVVADLQFVLCVRNPLDVAESVRARDGGPLELGLELWRRYTELALTQTSAQSRQLAFYEDFFVDWQAALDPVLRHVGLPRLEKDPARARAAEAFIRPTLHHHRHSLQDVVDSPIVSPDIKDLYRRLMRHDARPDRSADIEIRSSNPTENRAW